MPFCTSCGGEVADSARFCSACGEGFEAPAATSDERSNRRRRRAWVTIGVVAVSLVLVGALALVLLGGPNGKGASSHTLRGEVQAPRCGGGYDLVGASVTVHNEKGDTVGAATARLQQPAVNWTFKSSDGPHDLHPNWTTGRFVDSGVPVLDPSVVQPCIVSFETDVAAARFYRVQVGTHDGPSFAHDDVVAQRWKVSLTLG